jgi:hypothetical protein
MEEIASLLYQGIDTEDQEEEKASNEEDETVKGIRRDSRVTQVIHTNELVRNE